MTVKINTINNYLSNLYTNNTCNKCGPINHQVSLLLSERGIENRLFKKGFFIDGFTKHPHVYVVIPEKEVKCTSNVVVDGSVSQFKDIEKVGIFSRKKHNTKENMYSKYHVPRYI